MRDFSGPSETWTRKKFKRVKRFLKDIGCGECKEWFHPECIGTSREDLDKNLKNSDSEWFCEECVRAHKRPKIT